MFQEIGRVLFNDQVAERIFLMRLEVPRIAAAVRPAQFINIRVSDGWAPYLRRPFSVVRRNPKAGWVDVLYDDIGAGTRALSRDGRGDPLDIIGPLGRPYVPRPDAGRVILVAGGVGIVPLAFWANEDPESDSLLLFGAASRGRLPDPGGLMPPGFHTEIATDDGSVGHRGFVTELMEAHLTAGPCQVFCCGPTPMMKAAAGIACRHKARCVVSLENHMACGFGACVGCIVEYPDEVNPYLRNRRVCVEGPVFDAEKIAWS